MTALADEDPAEQQGRPDAVRGAVRALCRVRHHPAQHRSVLRGVRDRAVGRRVLGRGVAQGQQAQPLREREVPPADRGARCGQQLLALRDESGLDPQRDDAQDVLGPACARAFHGVGDLPAQSLSGEAGHPGGDDDPAERHRQPQVYARTVAFDGHDAAQVQGLGGVCEARRRGDVDLQRLGDGEHVDQFEFVVAEVAQPEPYHLGQPAAGAFGQALPHPGAVDAAQGLVLDRVVDEFAQHQRVAVGGCPQPLQRGGVGVAAEAGPQDITQCRAVERRHLDVVDQPVDPELVDTGRRRCVLAAGGEHAEPPRGDQAVQTVTRCGVDQMRVVDADDRAVGRGAVQSRRLHRLQTFAERGVTLCACTAVPAGPAHRENRAALVGSALERGGEQQALAHPGTADEKRSAAVRKGVFDSAQLGFSCSYRPVEYNIC